MKTKYEIACYKTENLSPDEKNAMRRNQSGIWLCADPVYANSRREALKIAREQTGRKCQIITNR